MIPPTPHGKLVSSQSILRSAARRLQPAKWAGDGHGTCDNWLEQACDVVEKIWCSVGLVVERSLLSAARGVRIESLGTFALDAKGRAWFFLAADFAARHRLLKYDACSGGMLAGGSVNTRLNVARLAATAGSTRPDAERVVEAVLRTLHQRLASGKSVVLSFHNVADFTCTPHGQATMKFLSGFRQKQKKLAANAIHARTGVARISASPTPWGALAPTRSTRELRNKAAFPSPGTIATDDSGRHAPGAWQDKPVGGQRRPASSCSAGTARPSHSGNAGRPETTHGNRAAQRSSRSENCSTSSCDNSHVASSNGRIDATEPPAREPWAGSISPRCHHTDKNARHLAPSVSSSRISPRSFQKQCKSYQRKGSGGGNSDNGDGNGDGDETRTSTQENACRKRPQSVWVRQPTKHAARPTFLPGRKGNVEEERLSDLLCRRTLAQAGQEGIDRLVEILRLACVSTVGGDRVDNSNGAIGDGRLSGRELLLALRDVSTTLESAELAETTKIFQRQPDGCVSLPALLAKIRVNYRSKERVAGDSYGNEGKKSVRCLCRSEGDKGNEAAPMHRSTACPAAGMAGALMCAVSEAPAIQNGELTPAPCGLTRHQEKYGVGNAALSTPRLSESSTIARILRTQRQTSEGREKGGEESHEKDIVDSSPVGGRSVSAASTAQAAVATSIALPRQDRRQCWVAENRKGGGDAGCSRKIDVAGKSPADDIADLAGIVFDPPCSLERLLHVLQASKVSERPTMSSAALGARLRQLRPGLDKAKAKQLAAAGCRYPEKEARCWPMKKLHSLLERRFGRRKAGSNNSSGENATTVLGAFAQSCNSGTDIDEIIKAPSSMPTTGTTGSTVSPAALPPFPCAAVRRVRRKLFASGEGLNGLRTALFSAGCRSGHRCSGGGGRGIERGSLSKDELRRALTIACGTGSTPPTAKDVDDLFTLCSDQFSAGERGGKVKAETVFRELRGELSPFREKVVRQFFREIFGSGENNNSGSDNNRMDRSSDGMRGDTAGLGGWCSFVGPGSGNVGKHAPSAACPDGGVHESDAEGGRTPGQGISIDQFLEYYRGVSAGIESDDDFEAAVRAPRPQQRTAVVRCDQGGFDCNATTTRLVERRGRSRAAGQATSPSSHWGANDLTGKEGAPPGAGSSAHQTKRKTTKSLRRQIVPFGGKNRSNRRNAAAVRVQAVFRGHKGRSIAAGEGRKRARLAAADREAEEELRRPRAAASRRSGGRILRPKVASTYGF
ncbi:unnamed protein product [Scytosiphon promiscuus]